MYRLVLCIRLSGGAFSVFQDNLPLNAPPGLSFFLFRRYLSDIPFIFQ